MPHFFVQILFTRPPDEALRAERRDNIKKLMRTMGFHNFATEAGEFGELPPNTFYGFIGHDAEPLADALGKTIASNLQETPNILVIEPKSWHYKRT